MSSLQILAAESIYATITVLVLCLIYRWLVRPLNRVRRLQDFVCDPQATVRSRQYLPETNDGTGTLPVYPNGWFCIAESPDIKPKGTKRIYFLGQQLTLLRAMDGQVHLVSSYCPHLGANFNVGGRVVDNNCLQCPFHGWIFSAESGRCTRIPYSPDSIPEQAKVTVWPVAEKNEHIYAWYHCNGKLPSWEIPEIEEIASGEWRYSGRTEHEVSCLAQELPENAADLAHLNYLHLSAPSNGSDITKIKLDVQDPVIKHSWNGEWEALPPPQQHIAVMLLEQVVTVFKKTVPLTKTKLAANQVGPGIVHMIFDFGYLGQGVVIQHVTPEQPLFQRARFVMYSNLPKLFAKIFMLCEAYQFERDVFVWSNKCYVRRPLLVKKDGPILKFRRWYNQFYQSSSPRLQWDATVTQEAKSVLDW